MTFFFDKKVCAEWERWLGAWKTGRRWEEGEHTRGRGRGVEHKLGLPWVLFLCWLSREVETVTTEERVMGTRWQGPSQELGSGQNAGLIKGRRPHAAWMGRRQGGTTRQSHKGWASVGVRAGGPGSKGYVTGKLENRGIGGKLSWKSAWKSHGSIFIWHFIETEGRSLND